MPLKIGVLDGDDIGLEIVPAAVEVAKAAAARHGVEIDWRALPIGRRALDTHGSTLPKETLDALPLLDGWILGPIGHRAYPKRPEAINPHPILRKRFNLFANVRPTRSYPDIGCLHENVDLVIVRENNEGFQPDRNAAACSSRNAAAPRRSFRTCRWTTSSWTPSRCASCAIRRASTSSSRPTCSATSCRTRRRASWAASAWRRAFASARATTEALRDPGARTGDIRGRGTTASMIQRILVSF